jgi:hypothetical protein
MRPRSPITSEPLVISSSTLVSVVVPVHNGARYLAEALDSVLAQTHRQLEILVVDDGSTDDTPAVVARYGERLRLLRHADNRGPSAARNIGLRAARGPFVAFLDSDDRWLPEKLARQAAVLDARPDVGLVYTGWWHVDAERRRFGEPVIVRDEGDLFRKLVLGNLVHPVAVMVRRSLLEQAGGFDDSIRYNEDWDLFLRLSLRGMRWAGIEEPLCEYRVHPEQATRHAEQMLTDRLTILERTFADPALPADVAALRAEAFQEACLLGAAGCFREGATAAGHDAFHAAASARPTWLTEPRSLRRFCRLLAPAGQQRQSTAAANWWRTTHILRVAVRELFARPDLEPDIARLRAHTRLAVLAATAYLARRSFLERARGGAAINLVAALRRR